VWGLEKRFVPQLDGAPRTVLRDRWRRAVELAKGWAG
jgi:hypothetical protein